MTPERMDELEALCAAATDGEWSVGRPLHDANYWTVVAGDYADDGEPDLLIDVGPNKADAAFIAAARTALPEALADLRTARAMLADALTEAHRARDEAARLRGVLAECGAYVDRVDEWCDEQELRARIDAALGGEGR